MRSMWKGHIRFHLVTIPIRLYSAEESSNRISFNQLHRQDHGRIGYVKTCKKCGQEVAGEEIVRGYEYEPDQYVVLKDEDLDQLKVKSTKIIEIEGFVDAEEVHPMLYDKPYFAGPDGPVATRSYALLREALARSGKMGVGRIVLRDREDVVVMSPIGPGIVLYKLRYAQEVRDVHDVPQVEETAEVKESELELAQQLIETMSRPFEEIEYRDRYQEALKELIEARIEGREVVTVEEEEAAPADIMSALEASIAQARASREPMKRADGKRAPRKKAKAG
jgi:DNA end-binding protein Ku